MQIESSFVYSYLNTALGPCVIPRNDYTSSTSCYGLGVDEFCGIKAYDLEGPWDGWFKSSGNLTGCNCSPTVSPYGTHKLTNNGIDPSPTIRDTTNCGPIAGAYILDYVTPDLTVTIS